MTQPAGRILRDLLLLCASAPLLGGLPFLVGGAGWLTPPASGFAAWLFLRRHHRGPRGRVVGGLLAWAFCLTVSLIVLSCLAPERAAALIPNGASYWEEMVPFVDHGAGAESSPAVFIPIHVRHLLAFALLSAVSGGLAGLMLGAYLTGYMSFYVGRLAAGAETPLLAALLGWPPWSVLRVIAFVMLGVSLSRLLLARPGWSAWWREERRPLALASLLWLGDLALKASIAPAWAALLRGAAGCSGAPLG